MEKLYENIEKKVKVISLLDHEYIFIQILNTIHIYESIRFKLIEKIFLESTIKAFEINEINLSIILVTSTKTSDNLHLFEIPNRIYNDYQIYFNYTLKEKREIDRVENMSISPLGDVLVTIDKAKILKFYSTKSLDVIRKGKIEQNFDFPFDYFKFTQDTKNIIFFNPGNSNEFHVIHKPSNNLIITEEISNNLATISIPMPYTILNMKEYRKDISAYTNNENNSIFLLLTENLDFIVLRKLIENETPSFNVIFYLDLRFSKGDKFSYFDVLLNNVNKYYLPNFFNTKIEETYENIETYLVNPDSFSKFLQPIDNNNIETFNITNFKNTHLDYLILSIKSDIYIFKIEGFNTHPLCTVQIELMSKLIDKENSNNQFRILSFTKGLEKKVYIYLLDKSNLIMKCFIDPGNLKAGLFISDRYIKVPIKIDLIRFNPKSKKIFILDTSNFQGKLQSHLCLSNKDFIVKKAIYFPFKIEKFGTVLKSNFIYFLYEEDIIVFINFRSKFFSKSMSNFNIADLEKHINIKMKDITLEDINKINKIRFNNMRVDKKNEKILFEVGIITDKYIIISDLMIEVNSSLSDKEFIYMNTLRKFEKLVNNVNIMRNYLIMPNDDKQKVLSYNREGNMIKLFNSLQGNKLIFTLLIEDDEILYIQDYNKDGVLYMIILTPMIIILINLIDKTCNRNKHNLPLKKEDSFKVDIHLNFNTIYIVILFQNQLKLINFDLNFKEINKIKINLAEKFILSKENQMQANLKNNLIVFNNEQIDSICSKFHRGQNDIKSLVLNHATQRSIFELDTSYDYFLSNNISCLKVILNIFANDTDDNKNILPFLKLKEDVWKKLFLDFNINIDLTLSEKKDTFSTENQGLNLQRKFSFSESNANLVKKYPHIKNIYEQIYSEMYSSCDHITKYFNVKFNLTKQNYQETFKLPTSDLCWITLIHDQEYLIKSIFREQSRITWKFFKMYCIPIWIKNDFRLKELLEIVAKNEYKILKADIITENKSFAEHVSLYYYLAGKMHILLDLIDKEKNNNNIKTFLLKDFKDEKVKKAARNNALELKKQKRYIFSIFFLLLGGDLNTAIDISIRELQDINLAILILKLYPDVKMTEKKVTHVLQEYFVDLGLILRDPWLTISGYIFMKKIDLALEYILNYSKNYEISNEILNNVEDYTEYVVVIKNVFHICQFEYRILLFAKNLEKIYKTLLDEQTKNTKSQQNTNFDDIWGDDFDDGGSSIQTTTATVPQIKELKIKYNNICLLALLDCLNRNSIFNSIFTYCKEFNYFRDNSIVNNYLTSLITNRLVKEYKEVKRLYDKFSPDILKCSNKLFSLLEEELKLSKLHILQEMNKELCFLEDYDLCYQTSSLNLRCRLDTLHQIYRKMENILKNDLIKIVESSQNSIKELESFKDATLIIQKINTYISMVLLDEKNKYSSLNSSDNFSKSILETIDSKTKSYIIEENLYIFRILVMIIIYLMIIFKSFDYFDKIRIASETLNSLIIDYRKEINLEKLIQCVDIITDFVNLLLAKISKQMKTIEEKINIEIDIHTNYFKKILHYCFIRKLNEEILSQHLEITTFRKSTIPKKEISKEILYRSDGIKENFKIITNLISINQSYIRKFQDILENYLNANSDLQMIFNIHEELKIIYLKNYSQETNFYKFCFIKIKKLFKNNDTLKEYENYFNLKESICYPLSRICRMIKYDRSTEEKKITKESIKIINQVFKSGIEVVLYNENFRINDFAINNCDNSKMSIALLQQGHQKVNLLYNLLKRKRSDDYYKLNEYEAFHEENKHDDYKFMIDNYLYNKYNEVYPIIQENLTYAKTYQMFESIDKIPPDIYNETAYDLYLEEMSNPSYLNTNFCNLIVSHPLLPLYLTTNNRGVIHTWNFMNESKTAIDEFFVEKITKDNINKPRRIKKLKFNHYGNEFFVLDDIGNLLFFKFDNNKSIKTPILSLWSSNSKSSRDGRYINNSGLVVSTSNKNRLHTTLWDFLLPINQSNILEFETGGNIVTSYNYSSSILVGNQNPGYITFLDTRRNNIVNNFQAHLDEIKQICISESENFMITLGKDSYIKIWDITFNKTEPQLIESFQPFPPINNQSKKNHIHIELVNNNLYASSESKYFPYCRLYKIIENKDDLISF